MQMATCSHVERQKNEGWDFRSWIADTNFREGAENGCRKSALTHAFYPDEISYRLDWRGRVIFSVHNNAQRRKREDERGDWWRGMWRREKSRAETVRCDKRGKNGSTTISHLHSRGRTSIRGNLKASPLSSENSPMDVRAVCHFVLAAIAPRTGPS